MLLSKWIILITRHVIGLFLVPIIWKNTSEIGQNMIRMLRKWLSSFSLSSIFFVTVAVNRNHFKSIAIVNPEKTVYFTPISWNRIQKWRLFRWFLFRLHLMSVLKTPCVSLLAYHSLRITLAFCSCYFCSYLYTFFHSPTTQIILQLRKCFVAE